MTNELITMRVANQKRNDMMRAAAEARRARSARAVDDRRHPVLRSTFMRLLNAVRPAAALRLRAVRHEG